MSESPAAPPTTRQVAMLLADIAVLLELNGSDSFRARAFANAARALEGVDADLLALARANRLTELRGIGSGISNVVREFVLTGRSEAYEELRSATPLGMYDLLRVPGLGPKRIHLLFQELGIESLDTLEEAAAARKIAALPGFGARTEAKIREGIEFARSSRRARRYPEALEVAVRLLGWLREQPTVVDAEIVGALRRRMEVVDRIDLVAASDDPETVLAAFQNVQGAALPGEVGSAGEAVLSLSDGISARLRVATPHDFVGVTAWETGSAPHVAGLQERAAASGLTFGPRGLEAGGERIRLGRESELYDRIGLQFVPPELREGLGELEMAANRTIPTLLELSDLRGTFHCHTSYSDGKATLREMVDGAAERGWEYLGIADHSQTAGYAGGLSIESVREQFREIDALNRRSPSSRDKLPRIFKGTESDILSDGSLDYPDDLLREFDYVVGSVHSAFGLPRDQMTERFLRAVRHPSLTILGHPTGRLLLMRDGYDLDIDAVIAAAAENGVIIEINANPNRLDLDWRDVRRAAALGIIIAINPDAHSIRALDHVAFGVNMARKAGLEPRQILNTWPVEAVEEYFARRKQGSQASPN